MLQAVSSQKELLVAIVGCSHGELEIIFNEVKKQNETGDKIDILLCCGDFQAMRNDGDLQSFHCPPKYKRLGDFHKYYSGEKEAPCLTIFIGGNHESSAFNMELPHGGWVAKNIYYMGFASVINFGGLRIGGWSGIFKQNDYSKMHYESPPFEYGQLVSVYHVRSIEKFRLSLLADEKANCIDIFMTHDWPVGITKFGDEEQLLRFKPYFKKDIDNNQLGNPHSRELMDEIRPRYWFSGHMHAKFEATVDRKENGQTSFLALNKYQPKGKTQFFFDVRKIQVDSSLSNELRYDPKWLAILKKTEQYEFVGRSYAQLPTDYSDYMPTETDLQKIDEIFGGDYTIPLNFKETAPPQDVYQFSSIEEKKKTPYYCNPQTKIFCERLQISNINKMLCEANMSVVNDPYYLSKETGDSAKNEDEIDLDFDGDDFIIDTKPTSSINPRKRRSESVEESREDSKKLKCDLNVV